MAFAQFKEYLSVEVVATGGEQTQLRYILTCPPSSLSVKILILSMQCVTIKIKE